MDKREVASDTTKSGGTWLSGDGRVAVGRWKAYYDNWYGNVDVDEVLFFNQKLTVEEIQDISNMI